jgi:hypothetical protein
MRWTRRVLVVGGVLMMAYAVVGALADPDTAVGGQLAFLAAVLVLHDGLFLPLVLGAGLLIGRWVPVPFRVPVRVGGIISVALSLISLPLVLGFGRRPDDPSALPLDYRRGLLLLLAGTWAVALGVGAANAVRRHRSATEDVLRE